MPVKSKIQKYVIELNSVISFFLKGTFNWFISDEADKIGLKTIRIVVNGKIVPLSPVAIFARRAPHMHGLLLESRSLGCIVWYLLFC